MYTIHKYPLDFDPETKLCTVALTEGYKILKVGEQNGVLMVWVLVKDPKLNPIKDLNKIKVKFRLYGTGWPVDIKHKMDFNLCFIDTVQVGPYVWHIFYEDA